MNRLLAYNNENVTFIYSVYSKITKKSYFLNERGECFLIKMCLLKLIRVISLIFQKTLLKV